MNDELMWIKSSYSGVEAGDCVEVAVSAAATRVYIRDSKCKADPVLTLTLAGWAAFIRFAASPLAG